MTQTRYTPEPWRYHKEKMVVRQDESAGEFCVRGHQIADLSGTFGTRIIRNLAIKAGVIDANGYLIAAAPELLKALEVLCKQEDREDEHVPPNSPIGKARAVIKKARGEV